MATPTTLIPAPWPASISRGVSPIAIAEEISTVSPETVSARCSARLVSSVRERESEPYPPKLKKRLSPARESLMWAAASTLPVTRPSRAPPSISSVSVFSIPGITR